MKANELRVGNLLTYKGRIITVDGVENDTETYRETWLIWIKGEGQAEPIADFEPIPLSPSILEACWFDNREGYLWFLNDDFYIHFRDGLLIHNGLPDGAPVLKYLHQLQNLYFALTGTELTVNLEKIKV